MAGFKTCFKCNAVKPLKEFYKHSQMADGHLNKCKSCAKADATTRRNLKLDVVREYDRLRAKNRNWIRAASEVAKAWRAQDKQRAAAQSAVVKAIKSGLLERKPCERCGNEKTVAHHEDYDKKLEVVWLCFPCNKARHADLRRLLAKVKDTS